MPKRPYVICHMTTSIDGKILTRRWDRLPLAEAVSDLYDSTASVYEVGSWFVGTKTLKEFFKNSKTLKEPKEPLPIYRKKSGIE
ncbi:hypothetical protein BH11CYA1_BH11CYA1_08620 [soil metagenome]